MAICTIGVAPSRKVREDMSHPERESPGFSSC